MDPGSRTPIALLLQFLVPTGLLYFFSVSVRSGSATRATLASFILGVVTAGFCVFQCVTSSVDWNTRRRGEPVDEGEFGGMDRDALAVVLVGALFAAAVEPVFRILGATGIMAAPGWLMMLALQLGAAFVTGASIARRTHSRAFAVKAGAGIGLTVSVVGTFTGMFSGAGVELLRGAALPLIVGTYASLIFMALLGMAFARAGAAFAPRTRAT